MWKSGLFGCFGNFSLCLISCCAAPLAIGKNAEYVGENSAVLWVIAVQLSPCIAGALLRGMIRKKSVSLLYISSEIVFSFMLYCRGLRAPFGPIASCGGFCLAVLCAKKQPRLEP